MCARTRSLAILEALAGVFYMALLIARLASLYPGRGRLGQDGERNDDAIKRDVN